MNPVLEDLEGRVWEPWEDLALVLTLKVETETKINVVNIKFEDKSEIQEKHIETAKMEARKAIKRAAVIKSLTEMIGVPKMTPTDILVVTTEDEVCGAAVITLPEIREAIRKRIGDFVIIPSSKHEVIVFSANHGGDYQMLNRMIMETNIEAVLVDDWLGDHAYICRDGVVSSLKDAESA